MDIVIIDMFIIEHKRPKITCIIIFIIVIFNLIQIYIFSLYFQELFIKEKKNLGYFIHQ